MHCNRTHVQVSYVYISYFTNHKKMSLEMEKTMLSTIKYATLKNWFVRFLSFQP